MVKSENFKLQKSQMDYLLEVSDKMDMPEIKEQLRLRLIQATKDFTLGDKSDSTSHRKLEE